MRRELDTRAAKHTIQASVSKDRCVSVDLIRQAIAFSLALCAAHLENVCEIGIELKKHCEPYGFKP